MKLDKDFMIVGILVLLILVGVVQTVQLIGMKSDIGEMSIQNIKPTSSSSSSSSSTTSSGGTPTNLQNLPGMVGGC